MRARASSIIDLGVISLNLRGCRNHILLVVILNLKSFDEIIRSMEPLIVPCTVAGKCHRMEN